MIFLIIGGVLLLIIIAYFLFVITVFRTAVCRADKFPDIFSNVGAKELHINEKYLPAIAVADTIKSRDKSAEILFIATKKGMEKTLIEKAGYKTAHIEMSGLQRSLSLKNIKTAICFFTSQIAAKKLLKAFQPDVVFATGNYLSYPLIHTAAKMGIPTANTTTYSTPKC